jgi:hypothetical protein
MRKALPLLLVTAALASCGPRSPLGFSLPAGDATRSVAAYWRLYP